MLSRIKETLTIVQILLGVVPTLRAVIEAIDVKGFGEQKKALVLQLVEEALNAAGAFGLDLPKDRILGPVSKFIDFIVAFLNAIGVLKHEEEPNPTPAPPEQIPGA